MREQEKRLRPTIFKKLTIDLREEVEDMPLTIDKEKDPLYKIGGKGRREERTLGRKGRRVA